MKICPSCGARYPDAKRACDAHAERALLEVAGEAADERAGRTVAGRYLLLERLGVGELGPVYRAWDERAGREVAVKVTQAGLVDAGVGRDRALAELKRVKDLASPGAVRIFDFGVLDSGELFVVMERIVGRDLGAIVARDGKLPLNRVRRLATALCDVLAEAHAAGVLHRDVKPANLMVTAAAGGGESLVLLDLGLVKRGDLATDRLAREDLTTANLGALSPEQIDGAEVSEATDIYGVGVTLFFLATGALPFRGETPVALMFQHQSEAPPHLMGSLATTPTVAAFDAVIQRCLRKRPAERFASVAALRDAIAAVPPEPRSATLTGIKRPPPPTRQPTRPSLTALAPVDPARGRRDEVRAAAALADDEAALDVDWPARARRARVLWGVAIGVAVAAGLLVLMG